MKGFVGGGGLIWLLNKEMEENTLNQWAWTGAGNETRRTHEGNTPKLPYNVMQPTNKQNFIITLLLLQNLMTKLI